MILWFNLLFQSHTNLCFVVNIHFQDNIGSYDTFSPLCVFLGDDNIQNQTVETESKKTLQSIALNMSVVFAYKKTFIPKKQRTKLGKSQHLRFLGSSKNTHALCCTSHAINSKGAPKSSSCNKSTSCRKPPKKPKGRDLLISGSLPDLFKKKFDAAVNSYTAFQPEETRGIMNALDTEDVAACAVSRYIENKLDSRSFACPRYSEFDCANNEDIFFKRDDKMCNQQTCDDSNLCTVDSWDSSNRTCVYTDVHCPEHQSCNPSNG